VFAAGFLMRPIGSWLFGRIADRRGRKVSLLVSVLMMCAGSLAIACLPTHASIGAAAPLLLLAARMLQGLSVGGEYGTTATYMSEIASHGRRGFLASFQYVTLIGGQLLAVLLVVVLQMLLDDDAMRGWGWRIPFVCGAVGALVALWLRSGLDETSEAGQRAAPEAGSLRVLLRDHGRAFLVVVGYTAGGSLMFYTFSTYMQKYLVNSAGMPIRTASHVMTACLLAFLVMQPVFGALSDRIGRRANMLCFASLGLIATLPILHLLRDAGHPLAAFALVTAGLAITSFYTSVSGLVKAEMFPPHVRALGVGLSYAIANALFGGSAEYIALALKNAGHESLFYVYVTVMMGIALVASLQLPRRPRYLGNA